MYSRSYIEEPEVLTPPANYDGNVFSDEAKYEKNHTCPPTNEDFAQSAASAAAGEATAVGATPKAPFSSILGFGKNIFGGLFGGGGFRLPRLGTEEILIIATAMFLLFSKEGDKECAILLLLLLLIN